MKTRLTLLAGGLLVSSLASAQYTFYSSSTFSGTTCVSNTGTAVGISGTGWGIWNPTVSGSVTNIGGTASGVAGISADGSTVGASAVAGDGKTEMARYNLGTGTWTTLGGAGGYSGTTRSVGYGISGDGSTVFGYGYGTYTGTGTGTYTGIDPMSNNGSTSLYNILPNANSINRINASNYDGTVLAGRMRATSSIDGAYYYSGGSAHPIMGSATDFYGEPKAISGDGRYIAGNFNYFTSLIVGSIEYRRPYIYDSATNSTTVFDSIAGLNGNTINADTTGIDGFVTGMSGDGNTVIGFYRETFPQPTVNKTWGFIWQRGIGIQSMDTWAAANGITDASNTWLVPSAISYDGQTIAGLQYTRSGYTASGFMIRAAAVPESGTLAVLGLGIGAMLRRRRK